MEDKKSNSLYAKVSPVAAKIARPCLALSLAALVIAAVLKATQTDPWGVFYAAVAERAFLWIAIISAVVWLVFDFAGIRVRLVEFLRKSIVSLKRNPSVIPLAMLLITFLMYSLNLTSMSNTTAKIQGSGMGLAQFCIMLFSLLSMVCLLNAFPRRKKANIPMIVIMYVMFAVIIYCDIHYSSRIMAALTRPESPIKLDASTAYIADAYNMLSTHMVLMGITAALVALLPVYSKLLRKINTTVRVEDNGKMEQIEIED